MGGEARRLALEYLSRERKTHCNFLKPQICTASLLLKEMVFIFCFLLQRRNVKDQKNGFAWMFMWPD